MSKEQSNFPASFDVDYQEKHNRATTIFRIFLAIPILIILALLIGPGKQGPVDKDGKVKNEIRSSVGKELNLSETKLEKEKKPDSFPLAGGLIVLPTVLMILFRKKYPKWWFDFNIQLIKFCSRVFVYLLCLRDEYPSTDEEQAIHIDVKYPDVQKELKRGMPLVKWLLAIPHFIILAFLYIGVVILTFLAWFAIIFTGKYPKSFFDYNIGVMRWSLRVDCYCILMTTDKYPPFEF